MGSKISWRSLSVGDTLPFWGRVARVGTDGLVIAPTDIAVPDGLLVPLASRYGDYRFNDVEFAAESDISAYHGRKITIEELTHMLQPTDVVEDWDRRLEAFGPWPEKYRDARFTYVDTETTGFDPDNGDRIIEIAAVVFEESGIIFEWSELINPGRKIPPESTNIHGITDAMVRGARNDGEVIAEFLHIIEDSDYIAAHNLPFDRKFLFESVQRNGLTWPQGKRSKDSLPLAQAMLKRGRKEGMVPNHRLGTLIKHFGFEHGSAHRALDDTIAGARVLNELLKMQAESDSVEV